MSIRESTLRSRELRRSVLSRFFLALCRVPRLRSRIIQFSFRVENGPLYSYTAREIMRRHFGVEIGAYSYGGCFKPDAFQSGVTVGRYVSIGPEVMIYRRDHPTDRLSTHPFFFNAALGVVGTDTVSFKSLEIAHDVWIGSRVVVTPGCCRIGLGSIIGAGAVVTRDVPDFAIVGGCPARLIRMRFADAVRDVIKSSRWWELPIENCVRYKEEMNIPIDSDCLTHPLLNPSQKSSVHP